MVPPESAQTSAAKYTALAGEASAEAAMKRVTAAEVGASRDGGKAAAEMSAAEAASEMTTAEMAATKATQMTAPEATTKMAAAKATTAKMAAPAETTMAAATAATRQCGGRKRGAIDGNGHCKNKDGFTQHDELLLRTRRSLDCERHYARDVRVSPSPNCCLPPLAPTWRGLRSSPAFTAL
jgi:hypothetical protein